MVARGEGAGEIVTPAGYGSVDRSELIDLRKIGRVIRRRWKLIALVSAIAMAVAIAAYIAAPKRYEAAAQVAIDRQEQEIVQVRDRTGSPVLTDSPSVDTQVEVLKARPLARRVVDKLKLDQRADFVGGKGEQALPRGEFAREMAADRLLEDLTVKRTGLTYAISVGFTSKDPQLAAAVPNAIVDEFVAGQIADKSGVNRETTDALSSRLAKLRGDVLAAEAAVQRYRSANNLLNVTDQSSITQQEISTLNSELATARAEQAAADARLNSARTQLGRGSSGEDLGEALGSSVISLLRQKRAEISRDVAGLSTRYGPNHPDLRRARRELADMDAQIQGEVRRIISNLSAQANVARQRTGSIAGSIGASEGSLAAQNNASVRLGELQRNADSTRSIYQTLLDRYREANAQQGTEQGDARVITHAAVPTSPSSPSLPLYIALGLLAALLGSIAAVAVAQLLEKGLHTADEVERELGLRALTSVPDVASLPGGKKGTWPVQFLLDHPQSAFAEAFRSLRTALQFGGNPAKVVALTSALPNEGKTTTAICLARSSAQAGLRAVLVDCDLRRRASSRQLTETITAGLVEVLEGKAKLSDALIEDPTTGAYMLPQRPTDQNNFELLGSDAMLSLIEELRQMFDIVVLDVAPVLPVAEARVIAARADAVLFLLRWGKTPAKAAEIGLRYLDQVGANVAGGVLTLVDVVEQAKIGAGDPGFYYHSYKKYYA